MSASDVVWYGRACVWIGVVLLLLMAFSGIQLGYVSLAAVVAVILGVALLLYSIPRRDTVVYREEIAAKAQDADV